MRITGIHQTVFLRYRLDGTLENLIQIHVHSNETRRCVIISDEGAYSEEALHADDNVLDLWINEPKECRRGVFAVQGDGEEDVEVAMLEPVKHWEVYFLQWSHHDTGYTDLPSRVYDRHCQWYEELLDQLDAAKDSPFDTRPRAVVEQFWSLGEYLHRAEPERAAQMKKYIADGDIELTALYGNLITEQLGHEEAYRAMYPAQKLARELGMRIQVAAHNDIPGVSWGICRALCDSGIRYFVPDFPDYYGWGQPRLRSFWEDEKIWPYRGPGAFMWEAQDGKRVMLWNGRSMDGNPKDGSFDWLEKSLEALQEGGYPYDVVRMQGMGGATDNSPYTDRYARHAEEWNREYAYPHITIATNSMFFHAFEDELERTNVSLPVIRGELPGQDYPLAAMSMAQITSTARRCHGGLAAAEKLLSIRSGDPQLTDPGRRLDAAWLDLLLADDHAYGHHFSAGPAMRASYWEKGVHAMRCEAEVHDMLNKAMASLADCIDPQDSEFRLVVFNLSGFSGCLPVATPMRPLDNCGTEMRRGNREPEMLKGYILNNRRHAVLDEEYIEGCFDLVDMESGERVEYQIDHVTHEDPELYAADREGLGQGTRRYGFFENPRGILATLRFVAKDMPAYGYRAYKLVKRAHNACCCAEEISEVAVHNGIYSVYAGKSGIVSVVDERDGTELLDHTCPYSLGELMVRRAWEKPVEKAEVIAVRALHGPVCDTLEIDARHEHLPQIHIRVALWKDVDQIDVSIRVLRDSSPLETILAAFPFVGRGIRYQGTLSEIDPVKDFMPGAQSDFLAVQDWVCAVGSDILLSSDDTAVMSLGGLHEGYVSPAHSCIAKYEDHPPLTEEDYKRGWMFPVLASNNFGTNFMCNQVFEGVYRFHIRRAPAMGDDERALWGEATMLAAQTMLTDRSRGKLLPAGRLLDTGCLQCLSLKRIDNDGDYVIRLWNHTDTPIIPRIMLLGQQCSLLRLDAFGNTEGNTGVVSPRSVACFAISIHERAS